MSADALPARTPLRVTEPVESRHVVRSSGILRWTSGLAVLVSLAASERTSQAQMSGGAFGGAIDRWVEQDSLSAPSLGSVLFIGSSSIRRWEQLALDFNDYRIVQRGFGGALFDDVNAFAGDIVLPYDPAAIVVWAGTNDLSSQSGLPQQQNADEVCDDYRAFVALVRGAGLDPDIFFLTITPTLVNAGTTTARDAANACITAEASIDPKLHIVDLASAFYALNPPASPEFVELYVDDLHLRRAGYDVWTSIVRPALEAVVPPNKAFVANPLTPGPGSRVLFDFGPFNTPGDTPQDGNPTVGPQPGGVLWNNWFMVPGSEVINSGERLTGLIDAAGNPTGINMTITGGFQGNGLVNGGLTSPSPSLLGDLGIATATQDYFFFGADDARGGGNDDVPGGFMLDGLNPGALYEFRFFGSRNTSADRRTEYRVTGSNTGAAVLQTSGPDIGADGSYDGNDDEVAVVSGISPDGFGQVFVDMTVVSGLFGYINAMEIRVQNVGFVEQPTPMLAEPGGTLSFAAVVAGAVPGGLQWERDGESLEDDGRISGATTSVLTISGATLADAGVYRLAATDGAGTVLSDAVVGGVRPAAANTDFNTDGSSNFFDLLILKAEIDAAP